MHPDIAARLPSRGFVTRPELLAIGIDDTVIAHHLHRGWLIHVGPGLYAAPAYRQLDAADQHRLRCRAIATRFTERIAFSHQSAALLHGLPIWGVDLASVHVTRVDSGRGRRQAGVSHHVGRVRADEVIEQKGLPVTDVARTLWDLAAVESLESALVTIDGALHTETVTDEDLHRIAVQRVAWRGSRRAKVAFSLSDSAAESPGETRARVAFREGGLPRPVSQYKVFDDSGTLLGVADWAWPEHRHLAEFDGLLKYRTELDLAREKAREDALRRERWGITRIVWSQLAPTLRPALAAELRRAMEDSRRRFGRRAS